LSELYQIKDFRFQYPNSKSALVYNGTNFIKENETLLLRGLSGSGKSTLLYALKGFLPETIYGKMTGEILFHDQPISQLSRKQKGRIGFLFQNPAAQMLSRTVWQELAFGMENLGFVASQIKNKITEYVKIFGISELLSRQVNELSGGEKQKIALLSILLMQPQVILFDEPTAFLDPDSAQHFIEVFNQIVHNKTIVIVEHNLQYLQKVVDRSLWVDKKGIVQQIPLQQIDWDYKFSKLQLVSPGKTILEISKLNFSYKTGKPILNSLNLVVKQGEIIGIVGRNGAGKSTLLKLLAAILKPDSGKIIMAGKKIHKYHYKELYQQVGLLFQNPENHFLYETAAKEVQNDLTVLAKFLLKNSANNNPFNLSEGEKRRLSLAIQQKLKRQIFLWDEPTFGQDRKSKEILIELLAKMQKSGKTFIIVSHDRPFLNAVCSRILELKGGKLYEQQKD
jgi:energy-coupling factor transport system ATP-binding protein